MHLAEEIKNIYPELQSSDFLGPEKKIMILDEGDGIEYIAKWDYEKPIPEGLVLGKP